MRPAKPPWPIAPVPGRHSGTPSPPDGRKAPPSTSILPRAPCKALRRRAGGGGFLPYPHDFPPHRANPQPDHQVDQRDEESQPPPLPLRHVTGAEKDRTPPGTVMLHDLNPAAYAVKSTAKASRRRRVFTISPRFSTTAGQSW